MALFNDESRMRINKAFKNNMIVTFINDPRERVAPVCLFNNVHSISMPWYLPIRDQTHIT